MKHKGLDRYQAEDLARRLLKLPYHSLWGGTDSSVWIHPKSDERVLKVTLLSLPDLRDHREMVRLGDKMLHVARVYDVRPLCFASFSTPVDPWLYGIVIQERRRQDFRKRCDPPPIQWTIGEDVWVQEDSSPNNWVDGVWVDTARVRRIRISKEK